MSNTGIEYGQVAWNPVTGCTPISEGCQNCWAQRMSKRLAGRNGYPKDDPFKVTLHYKRINEPLGWKKPRMVLVNFMGDLFHDDVPDEYLDEVFSIVLGCSVLNNRPHTFMMLTKRPERLRKYLTFREPVELLKTWADIGNHHIQMQDADTVFSEFVYSATCRDWDKNGRNSNGSEHKAWGYINRLWPLPNLWLGVTAENQARADERIPILLQIPAAKRFVSIEPMLGPVNLTFLDYQRLLAIDSLNGLSGFPTPHAEGVNKLDWVICGGESGPGARPMHPDWVRSLRDQCVAAGTPFYFKQWGEWYPDKKAIFEKKESAIFGNTVVHRIGKKNAGRLLDGREWLQMPGLT